MINTPHPSKLLIVIPARYNSSRLPGKPLIPIAGTPLIERTYASALKAAQHLPPSLQNKTSIVVATDDERISTHLTNKQIPVVMTDPGCNSGTERLIDCYKTMQCQGAALNLQGDAPFIPPSLLAEMMQLLLHGDKVKQVLTCAHSLSWKELDWLKEHKKTSPFSGTCAIADKNNNALWFSKNIIPAIRKEADLRSKTELSPVMKHLGVYGFQPNAIDAIQNLPEGHYESIEELEQLRWIEAGMHIYLHKTILNDPVQSLGIDSPQDVAWANNWLSKSEQSDDN